MADVEKTVEPFVGRLELPDAPIDVKVVGTVKTVEHGDKTFVTGAATMSNGVESVPVLPKDPNRTSGTILNPAVPVGSGQTVWILAGRAGSAGNGFPLMAGAALDIEHQGEVFALCPTATSAAQVSIYYAVERA